MARPAATRPSTHRVARCLRLVAVAVVLAVLAACGGAGPESSTSRVTLVSIGAGLRGPSGAAATVYATGLEHASAFAYDAAGRLWVATAAYTDDGTDAVSVVDAAGATPAQVIGGLHTPLGLLWLDGELYVAAAGGVTAYAGLDGTTFSSSRTVLALAEGTGEVNGLALGADGRIYLGISAPCDSCTPTEEHSASIVSFRPDGTDVQTYASGIRAAIGLAFAPATTTLFATMNQRDEPAAQVQPDALSAVAQGSDWGFPDCWGQGGSACAGVPEPTAELAEHAAVSGVAFTSSTTAVVAEWAKAKVVRVVLHRSADGTYTSSSATTFLTGLRSPMAVTTAPDGALLVGDWTTGRILRITGV